MLNNKISITFFIALLSFACNVAMGQYVLKQARDQAAVYNYTAAKPLFIKAYNKKQSLEAARGLAEIFRNNNEYVFAESWYTKIVAMPGHTLEDELSFAEVLMNNSKYAEAKQQLQSYLSKKGSDRLAENMLTGCDEAERWLKNPVKGNLENMQVFNSQYSDWGLVRINDQFVFASDRPYDSVRRQPFFQNSNIKRDHYGWTGNSYLHLYQSNGKDSNSTKLLNRDINGDYHSASASYTGNGREMYYAKTMLVKKGTSFLGKEKPYTLNVTIHKCDWDTTRQNWNKPVDFPYNDVFDYSVGDPWISSDGTFMLFVSNHGEGNIGGTDIYSMQKDIDGKWMPPVNMGRDINTEGNERTPFIDSDGILYFASNGRVGMGGLDIYKAVRNNANGWTVTNMGSPVNSAQDDFAPFFTGPRELYFSSNRLQGKGSDDIYRFNLAKILVFALEGTVVDKATREPLKNTVITLFNKITGTPEKTLTDERGHYGFKLDSLSDYDLSAVKTDYASVTGISFTTKGLTESQILRRDIELEKVELNKPVKLDNIYFDLDKSNIRPDAEPDLIHLVKLLNDNPTWKVEMSSHTDSRANDAYNMKLSQRRAESTVKYLVDHGIAQDRLTAKGYGETRLVNKCSNGVKCSEDEHQQNRRTEFTIIDK